MIPAQTPPQRLMIVNTHQKQHFLPIFPPSQNLFPAKPKAPFAKISLRKVIVHMALSANSLMALNSCVSIWRPIVLTRPRDAMLLQKKGTAAMETGVTSYTSKIVLVLPLKKSGDKFTRIIEKQLKLSNTSPDQS